MNNITPTKYNNNVENNNRNGTYAVKKKGRVQNNKNLQYILANKDGNLYHPGRSYDLIRKCTVADTYIELLHKCYPRDVPVSLLARTAGVSWNFAKKITKEIELFGDVVDPDDMKKDRKDRDIKLTKYDELCILSLYIEKPGRPNIDYVGQLFLMTGTLVSDVTISNWFLRRFGIKGSFCLPNLVPLDKFKLPNLVRFKEFYIILNRLPDRYKYNFLDEKHIVNKDCLPKKVRKNPLTGYIPNILVSGDFRESYSIFACISANRNKASAMTYNIQENNGTSEAFMDFIIDMIASRWLKHGEIIIMDNSRVHTGKDARTLEKILWEYKLDGRPLRILVVYLPTRSPELNPIELVFHILARRVRSFRYHEGATSPAKAVIQVASKVMDEIDFDLVDRTIDHCGYYFENEN